MASHKRLERVTFTIIPHSALESPHGLISLSQAAQRYRSSVARLFHRAALDKYGRFHASNRYLAEMNQCDKACAHRFVAKLERDGLLWVHDRGNRLTPRTIQCVKPSKSFTMFPSVILKSFKKAWQVSVCLDLWRRAACPSVCYRSFEISLSALMMRHNISRASLSRLFSELAAMGLLIKLSKGHKSAPMTIQVAKGKKRLEPDPNYKPNHLRKRVRFRRKRKGQSPKTSALQPIGKVTPSNCRTNINKNVNSSRGTAQRIWDKDKEFKEASLDGFDLDRLRVITNEHGEGRLYIAFSRHLHAIGWSINSIASTSKRGGFHFVRIGGYWKSDDERIYASIVKEDDRLLKIPSSMIDEVIARI